MDVGGAESIVERGGNPVVAAGEILHHDRIDVLPHPANGTVAEGEVGTAPVSAAERLRARSVDRAAVVRVNPPVDVADVHAAVVPDSEAGLASGLINTTQQVGGALGLAVLSAISISVTGTSRLPSVLTDGFHSAFLAGAGIAALGLVATLTLIRSSDSRAHTRIGEGAVPAESPA